MFEIYYNKLERIKNIKSVDTIVIDVSFWLKEVFVDVVENIKSSKDFKLKSIDKQFRHFRQDIDTTLIDMISRMISLATAKNLVLVSEGILPLLYSHDIRNKVFLSSSIPYEGGDIIDGDGNINKDFKKYIVSSKIGDWSNMIKYSYIYYKIKDIKTLLSRRVNIVLPENIYESSYIIPGHCAPKIHQILNAIKDLNSDTSKNEILLFCGEEVLESFLNKDYKFSLMVKNVENVRAVLYSRIKDKDIKESIIEMFGSVDNYLFTAPLFRSHRHNRELPPSQFDYSRSNKNDYKIVAKACLDNQPLVEENKIQWRNVAKFFDQINQESIVNSNVWYEVGFSPTASTSKYTDELVEQYKNKCLLDGSLTLCKMLKALFNFRNTLNIDIGLTYSYTTLPLFSDVSKTLNQVLDENMSSFEEYLQSKSGVVDVSDEQWALFCSSINSWKLYNAHWGRVCQDYNIYLGYFYPTKFVRSNSCDAARIPLLDPLRDLWASRQFVKSMTFTGSKTYLYTQSNKAVIIARQGQNVRGRGRGRGVIRGRGRGRGRGVIRGRGRGRGRGIAPQTSVDVEADIPMDLSKCDNRIQLLPIS